MLQLRGRSILLATSGQLSSALVVIEIDGVARRMLLCPPDVKVEHVANIIEEAKIDAIVTDQPQCWADRGIDVVAFQSPEPTPANSKTERATEWLMLASGTSGAPKIVRHTLEGLCRADPRRRFRAWCRARMVDVL